MADENILPRDQNHVTAAGFQNSLVVGDVRPGQIIVATGRIKVDSSGGSGSVTEIDTGTGLTGGPITTTGTISLDSQLAPLDTLGSAGQMIRVNAGATALEYFTAGGGTGTVTTVSVVTNQGVSGSVANPTTTPAITLSLGALTGVTSIASGAVAVTSTSVDALAVGANGITNPALQVDASTATQATGVAISGKAAGTAPTIGAISSGTNEGLNIFSKGTGSLTFQAPNGADVTSFGNVTVQKQSARALAVGITGNTNPAFEVNTNTASSATGVLVTAAAAGGGVAVAAISSGTNESMTINAKGSGTINLGNVSTGAVQVNSVPIATTTGTQTITNKRITRRVVVTTQSATPTINTDNTDMSSITGLAQAITSMTTNLSGTPVLGDFLEVQITDNGTARAITWGASFSTSTVALPTTTVISTLLHVLFEWSSASSTWVCVAVA